MTHIFTDADVDRAKVPACFHHLQPRFAGAPPSALGRAAEAVAEAILDAHQRVSAASVTIHMPHASIPAMFDGVGATMFAAAPFVDRCCKQAITVGAGFDLVTRSGLPARNVSEFVALARASPGKTTGCVR